MSHSTAYYPGLVPDQDPARDLRQEIERAINKHSGENGSNTPDFILANFLWKCLIVFDDTVKEREEWYGRA